MGMELEYKFSVPGAAALETILADPAVNEMRQEDYRTIEMATTYFDTPDRRLSARRWTLRLRKENDAFVATCKTPGQGAARGEWECEAATIEEAIPKLLAAGAPAELQALLDGQSLEAVCAARFTRRAALVKLPGAVAELSGDLGVLSGGGKEAPLCEIELEFKSGNQDAVAAAANDLARRFSLIEEPKSKFVRAMALTKEEP